MASNPYISDILSQAEVLGQALSRFDFSPLEPVARRLLNREFDRILVTGMGASFYAGYPASLRLAPTGLPVIWMDTAELIHYGRHLLTPRSLLWILSQSGWSAEVVSLVESIRNAPAGFVLSTTNDLKSPVAEAAHLAMPIHADPELTVSTRTYMNMLAQTLLAAAVLSGQELQPELDDLKRTAEGIGAYLLSWTERLDILSPQVGVPRHLALIGRGPSLASAYTGALVIGEAAKFPALGFNAGEFRHGPLELANPDLAVMIFAGHPQTLDLNYRLLQDLMKYSARPFWLGSVQPEDLPEENWIPIPEWQGNGLPMAEILPAQLLSVHLAQIRKIVPGEFYYSGKITLTE